MRGVVITTSSLWSSHKWFIECSTPQRRDVRSGNPAPRRRWRRPTFLLHPLRKALILSPLITRTTLFFRPRTGVSQSTRVAQILFPTWPFPPLRTLGHLATRAFLNSNGWFSSTPSARSILISGRTPALTRPWRRNVTCRTPIASVTLTTTLRVVVIWRD